MRIPLSDLETLQTYADFIHNFSEHGKLVVIVQDRAGIENANKLEISFDHICFPPCREPYPSTNRQRRQPTQVGFSLS